MVGFEVGRAHINSPVIVAENMLGVAMYELVRMGLTLH